VGVTTAGSMVVPVRVRDYVKTVDGAEGLHHGLREARESSWMSWKESASADASAAAVNREVMAGPAGA
jgi:hypothetical protein